MELTNCNAINFLKNCWAFNNAAKKDWNVKKGNNNPNKIKKCEY